MRRLLLTLGLLASGAMAADTWVGEIASSGSSTTNASTATPFVLAAQARYSVQCDQNVNLKFGALGTTPVATTAINGMFFVAQRPSTYDICTYASSQVWAIIPVTAGSANCEVFRVPMNSVGSGPCP